MIIITSICLVRHGETDWNALGKIQGRTDITLNGRGILQADECRQFLMKYKWDVIITSPLKRAKETAEIINKDSNIPLIVMDEFLERYFGSAEGMTMEERQAAYPKRNYPNQEDRETFNKRIMNGLQEINKVFSGKKVLLVAHDAVINAILSNFSHGEIGSNKTKLLNACISNIEFLQEQWNIKDYNKVTHLSQYNEKGTV